MAEKDWISTVLKYIYDGFGNITSVRDMASGTDIAKFAYDNLFRLTEESTLSAHSAHGSRTVYGYDILNRVTSKTIYDDTTNNVILGKETYAYNIFAVNPTDPNKNHSVVTHTVEGDTNAPSVKTTTYTDNAGRVAKQGYFIGATEYTDDYTYDYTSNRLTAKTAYTKQYFNARPYTAAWEYDYANRVTREYDTYGKYSSTEYNALGQAVSAKDPKANDTNGSA